MRLNIIAMGDVGQNLLLGLKLLGGGVIDSIGIYDINENLLKRLEMEMGQMDCVRNNGISTPAFPTVEIVEEEELLNCDILVFCASKGVPPLGAEGDVRMAQLKANGELVRSLGERIKSSDFAGKGMESNTGLVLVMSDPVDQLCNILLESSGLEPEKIRGLGLGVMNARAMYFARKDERFASYLKDGRVFGPHGEGLIVVNSLSDYDDILSEELTELVKTANLKVRELGYKPYMAPAISSGALSILGILKGEWTYGSVYVKKGNRGTYFGMLSRLTSEGTWEIEEASLTAGITERIEKTLEAMLQ